ncbi:Nif3-like dinuclear metal center hexameric protein [uncultured Methanobrevibacter sp.]|uniref:Nif3-like dinuclear metal center hexameric protein n=1 Tax=uncultured Methanobrevibacter sp. TaxID=253161 RepID=UPI00261F17F1|nr:Nif3-like dinuclear metal center hexameric protein [uncultured Methanobrevibacter sp.]
MKLKEIIEFIDKNIPKTLALKNDEIGFKKEYDLNQNINSIEIFMDLYPEFDINKSDTLILTHHPPLFNPKTPTYTIHSNWDIITGGANEALAKSLNLKVISPFDRNTNIGRICKTNKKFKEFKNDVLNKFEEIKIVNKPDDNKQLNKVGIISGFGLKNTNYIKLAHELNLELLISGDLTQESAILAKNLDITLIDLGHHNSEVPGLYKLKEILEPLNIKCEVINIKPWKTYKI